MKSAPASLFGRLLSALVVLLLIFLFVASFAVGFMLWLTSALPDGAIYLLKLRPDLARDAGIVATGAGRLAMGAVTVENLTVTAIVLVALLLILRSASRGTPFVEANVGRLRLIACAYAAALVARFAVPSLVPVPVAELLATSGWSYNLGDGGSLLVALVLAEVFREGIRLRADSEATI